MLGWAGWWRASWGRRASLKSSRYSCWLREKLMVVTPTMGGDPPSSPSMCFCIIGLGDEVDEVDVASDGARDGIVAPVMNRLAADNCPHVPPCPKGCPKGLFLRYVGEPALLLMVEDTMLGGIRVPTLPRAGLWKGEANGCGIVF